MSFGLTTDNSQYYRKLYALSVGHTVDCIDDTVYTMALIFSDNCIKSNISLEDAFENIDVTKFDYHLQNILEQKICDCFRKK